MIARMSDGRSNTNLGAFSQAVGNRDEGNFSVSCSTIFSDVVNVCLAESANPPV